ncbi:MAG TPA: hypothetical protein VJ781_00260 [Pyrinomonadaceae bacterium]|nr:hypothetical protein [Pyrinomonadaceae bacterium]
MTNRKNQNSILFLTTLGVYLGLLVVGGAAPQVFAHSATTRNFAIADEIEVKDDLDKKPDDERSPVHMSLGNYFDDVETFIATLRGLQKRDLFDPTIGTFSVGQGTQLPCVAANKVGSYTVDQFVTNSESIRRTLEWFTKRLTDGYSLGDCLPNDRLSSKETHNSKFQAQLDDEALKIEVSVKKSSAERAKLLASDLAATHNRTKAVSAYLVRARLYETTTFRSENDQVFLITHLPRADLVSLLAKGAK